MKGIRYVVVASVFLIGHNLDAQAPPNTARPEPEAAPLLLDAVPHMAVRTATRGPDGDSTDKQRTAILPVPGQMHVGMEVMVHGRPARTVYHQGKTYLPVRNLGQEYQIRIWNHGANRIVAVVSVDGLSVINGQPASEDHPGYVVAPSSSILIRGWRKSMDTVAAFRFVERDRSYAELVAKGENVGVIGLVAFEELVQRPMPMVEKRIAPESAKPYRSTVGSTGTEYGREVDSRIYYVPFVRSHNQRRITLYYDTVDALRAAGVPVDGTTPMPFPGDLKFAPPPPGYRGS